MKGVRLHGAKLPSEVVFLGELEPIAPSRSTLAQLLTLDSWRKHILKLLA